MTEFQLRSYQQECVDAILDTFSKESIASVNMFCGLGKTRVIVSTLNKFEGVKVLVFPTLQLVGQFIKDYKGFVDGEIKVCCSESSESVKDIKVHWDDISNEDNVICTTYHHQSLPNVLKNDLLIKLIVFDESHHTESDTVSTAIEENGNKIEKTLLVSATPPDSPKVCFSKTHYDGLNFLDENGKPVCADISLHLLLKEANNDREFLQQIVDVAKETGNRRILAYSTRVNNDDPDWNSVKRFYNDNQKHAKEMGVKLMMLYSGASASSNERDRKIQEFDSYPDDKIVILISCRTIGEGTDVKNANSVVFLDPKGSAKDIIQNIGRTTRPNKNGQASTVLIPVRVNREEYLKLETIDECDDYIRDNMADAGGFAMISNVVAAIKQCDEELYDILLKYPNRVSPKEKTRHYDENKVKCEEVPADGNCLFHSILKVDPKAAKDVSELRNKVADFMVENREKYEAYVENQDVDSVAELTRQDGHWNFDGMDVVPHVLSDLLQRQVHVHTDKSLEKPLEIINKEQFKSKNKILLDLTDDHYSPIVPVEGKSKQHKKGVGPVKPRKRYNISKDLKVLLKLKKADLDIEDRVSAAVEHTLVDNRMSNVNKAIEAANYYKQHNKWPSNKDKSIKFEDGSACIGKWLQHKRTAYHKNELEEKINEILSEADPNWHTAKDPNDKVNKAIEAANYFKQHNKWPVAADKTAKFKDGSACIGAWIGQRRVAYHKNELEEKINEILSEADPNWHTAKDPNDKVNKAIEAANYFKQHNKWPVAADKTAKFKDGSACIGAWIGQRRVAYHKNELEEKINEILSEADPNWHTAKDPNDKVNKAIEAANYFKQHNKWPAHADKTAKFKDGSACIGAWISWQRAAYKNNKLEQEIIDILSAVDANWHTPHDKVNKAIEAANYYKQHNKWPAHADKTIKFRDGSAFIGHWLANQRAAYKNNKLEQEINKILSAVDANWHTPNDKINKAHEAANYFKQHNKWPSNKDKTIKFKDGSAFIGAWIGQRRVAYHKNELEEKINEILSEADPNWHTAKDPNDKVNKAIEAANYFKQHNKWPSSHNKTIKFEDGSACIGQWLQNKRKAYKNNELDKEVNDILTAADANWHTAPRGGGRNPKSKLPPPPPPPPKEPTAEEIHEDLSKVEHDPDESRKAIRKYTPSQLTMYLKNKRDKVERGLDQQGGYVEKNPGFKELLNGIFSKNVVANEQQEGCVVVLDHTNFNTTSTLVGDGIKLEDIRVPNNTHAIEMQTNEEYGSCVNSMDLVDYIRSEKTPIRAMYADLCKTVSEAEMVIDALSETGRMAEGSLLMITICERSKLDSALSGGRDQISELLEKLQDLGKYKKISEGCVNYGAGTCMATYMWKLNKFS